MHLYCEILCVCSTTQNKKSPKSSTQSLLYLGTIRVDNVKAVVASVGDVLDPNLGPDVGDAATGDDGHKQLRQLCEPGQHRLPERQWSRVQGRDPPGWGAAGR